MSIVGLVLNIRIHDANQKTSHKSDISISTWNTNDIEYKSHGVKCNNLNDPEVINLQSVLTSSNCIGLLETHVDKSVDIILSGLSGNTTLSYYGSFSMFYYALSRNFYGGVMV